MVPFEGGDGLKGDGLKGDAPISCPALLRNLEGLGEFLIENIGVVMPGKVCGGPWGMITVSYPCLRGGGRLSNCLSSDQSK